MSLVERANAGLHDAALAAFVRARPAPARVLDLAAGTGAWARRLGAAGYAVTAVERDAAGFAAKEVPLVEADLDRPFAELVRAKGPFDAVTALEIVEHLESTRHFLRECRSLLPKDGVLLLTTPNIESIAGRLRFLATGHFPAFGRDPAMSDPTHISPLHSFLLDKAIAASGFRVGWHGYNAPTPSGTRALVRVVCALLRPFVAGAQGGDNHIYVLIAC
jgi:SAM-dependent methyltransferase